MEFLWKAIVAVAFFAGVMWWLRKVADIMDGHTDQIKDLQQRVEFLEDRLAEVASRKRRDY